MSPALVRVVDGETQVARIRVDGPGYSMFVADAVDGNGWTYVEDLPDPEEQPDG